MVSERIARLTPTTSPDWTTTPAVIKHDSGRFNDNKRTSKMARKDDVPIYKRGSSWYVRVPLGGGKYDRKSLGKVTQREALDMAERLLASTGSQMLFDDAAERFLLEHVSTLKRNSQGVYRWALATSADVLEGKAVYEITSNHLAKIETQARSTGMSSGAVRAIIAVLSSLFKWLRDKGVETPNPASLYLRAGSARKGSAALRVNKRSRWLTEDEETKLLAAIDSLIFKAETRKMQHTWLKLKHAVILSIDTGLREQELFRLLWDWVDLSRGELTVPASMAKSGRARTIPLLRRSFELLLSLPRSPTCDFVIWHEHDSLHRRYSHLDRQLATAMERAGLDKMVWHDLRRTCGCRLLQGAQTTGGRRMRIETVSRWLGHSDIRITQQVYAFLTADNLHDEIGTREWLEQHENPITSKESPAINANGR